MTNTVFVGNLAASVTEDQLRELFAPVGEVVSVKMMPPKKGKLPYGFVEMGSEAEAAAAIERLNGQALEGSPLAVRKASGSQPGPAQALARDIAQKLQETQPLAIRQIKLVITLCGEDFARALLDEILAIEAAGGMLTRDQSRRRTPGGAFLFLARSRAGSETRRKLYRERQKQAPPDKPPAATLPPLVWEERSILIQALAAKKGEASNVKITVIGRPALIEERKNVVIAMMEYAPTKLPAFPKGVPKPPQTPILYTMYIAAKQWQKVAGALADPEDTLIVEGLPVIDPEVPGISVFATNVTTRNLQAAARKPTLEAETLADDEDGSDAPKPKAKRPAPRPRALPAAPPVGAIKQLSDLRLQEAELREQLNEIKALPPEEQAGLGKTLQELKQVQAEIKALKQKYPRLS